ncbi:ATP-binding protein [Streptomyces sp. L7]
MLQESLTNVVKHGRNASTVHVVLHCGDDLVGFSVTDDGGPAPGSGAGARTGNGLTGMRERVAMFDGALRAGPTGSGWAVSGELKLGEPR